MYERDFRDYKKRKLSESDKGRGIKVVATSSPGTLIHVATTSIAANEWDEIWLKAVNTSATAVKLTVLWGGNTIPDDEIEITIPPESGLVDVIQGLVMNTEAEVRVFAATANVIVIHGFVNRYEQTPTSRR